MKKLFILAVASLTIALHSSASTIDDTKDDSITSYVYSSSAKVVWSTVKDYNVANFTKDGYKMKAFFDETGKMISTTRYLKNRNELPKAALDNLDNQYPGWGMTDLFEEQGLDHEMVYYARITDGTNDQILKIRTNGKLSKF